MPAVLASNFLVPNGTFVVEVLVFFLVIGALAKWVLPPINARLDERQATIRAALADAEEAKRRHEQAEADYRRTIDEARTEGRRLIEDARQFAEQERSQAQGRAQQEYERIVGQAQTDIEAEVRRATEGLREQLNSLVLTVVEKVVADGIDEAQHRALIDRTIAEVEREAGSTGVRT